MGLKKDFGEGNCWEIMRFITAFTSYSHSLVIFLFVKTAKEWMTERKKTGIVLKSIFISGIYDYFVVWNIFLNQ